MSLPARLSLAAPRGDAMAEAVLLAFALRGADLALVPVQTAAAAPGDNTLRLTLRRGAEVPVILHDPLAMLELAEDLHPDRPLHPRDPLRRAEAREGLTALPGIARLTERLARTDDQRDVDLNAHLLRGQLTLLSARLGPSGAGGRAPSLLELAAAPLLWRLEALDSHFETHLLTGLDALQGRLDWLTLHPLLARPRQTDLVDDWLSLVIAARGLVTRAEARPDWSRALGPEGETRIRPENALPLRGSRTKLRSIGSPRGSRY